jgi:hypothetical protein
MFQGNSLPPLLFCINIFPLTEQLNKLKTGYKELTTKTKVSHFLYKDYLKLIDKTEEELQTQMQAVRIISDDIHKKSGLDKRKKFCSSERKISSLAKFNISLQQRNTRVRTGKNIQVLGD